jgi:hypothetical protein
MPTRNKFQYSALAEIWGPGANKFIEGTLCFCLIADNFLLQEAAQVLEKVVISLWQV